MQGKKRRVCAIILCLIISAVAGLLAGCGLNLGPKTTENYTVKINSANAVSIPGSTVDMLAEIRPTVVDVTTTVSSGYSLGSGVIIGGPEDDSAEDPQYFIVTNHHVIAGGTDFSVKVLNIAEDGTETNIPYAATLIGSAPSRDIAVLSVRPGKGTVLKTAKFIADSDKVMVGTEVFAIGNPLGILGGTVTHGIISATKRNVTVGTIGLMTLMQTDASINGGNSGGGLFNNDGLLVGIINSGYDTYNGQNVEGLNFAIPAKDASFAAQSLIDTHVEVNKEVTQYGYVKGDATVGITLSTMDLRSGSSTTATATYLVGTPNPGSQIYSIWQGAKKAITAITVDGEKTDVSPRQNDNESPLIAGYSAFAEIEVGSKVTFEYRNITQGFGGSYSLSGSLSTVMVTAEQYKYEP